MTIQRRLPHSSLFRSLRSAAMAAILGTAALTSMSSPAGAKEEPSKSPYETLPGQNGDVDVFPGEQLVLVLTPDQVLVEIEDNVYVLPEGRELGVCIAGQGGEFPLSIETYEIDFFDIYRDGSWFTTLYFGTQGNTDFLMRSTHGASMPTYRFGGARTRIGDEFVEDEPPPAWIGGEGLTSPKVVVKPVDSCPTGRQ